MLRIIIIIMNIIIIISSSSSSISNVCMYTCVYIYIYIYTCIYIYIYTCIHTNNRVMYICIYIYTHLISYYILYISLSLYARADRNSTGRNQVVMFITAQNTTTTCVPSFFCPWRRTTSEVVVRRALGLHFQ